METETIPRKVIEFIIEHVHSIELLEVFALFFSQKQDDWSVEEVDNVIRSNITSLSARLDLLEKLGFIKKNETSAHRYHYAPHTDELNNLGESLMKAYKLRRTEVIDLIYTKPLKEILSFSNAFNMRGGKKG